MILIAKSLRVMGFAELSLSGRSFALQLPEFADVRSAGERSNLFGRETTTCDVA